MKIGILTYHRMVNDGSAMQAYCLFQLLRHLMPEAFIEIIDYRPKSVDRREWRKSYSRRPPFVNFTERHKRKGLDTFLRKYCAFSENICVTDDLQKAKEFIEAQKYDAVVVGSDTVWEVRKNGGAPLAPNIYFLPNIKGIKKIAFAASADQSKKTLLKEDQRRSCLSRYIKGFDLISIRDETTRKMLLELGLEKEAISFMPDPTILWDFSTIVNIPKELYYNNERLAGVAVGPPAVRKQVTRLMLKKGYRVINLLGGKTSGQFSIPFDYTLKQRLGIYKSFDLMITDRFHGSIFTLKLSDAPVIFIEIAAKYPELNSKGRDLFQRLEIEEMVLRYDGKPVPEDFLDKYLEIWKALSPDIKSRLALIRRSAKNGLDRICALINPS